MYSSRPFRSINYLLIDLPSDEVLIHSPTIRSYAYTNCH